MTVGAMRGPASLFGVVPGHGPGRLAEGRQPYFFQACRGVPENSTTPDLRRKAKPAGEFPITSLSCT